MSCRAAQAYHSVFSNCRPGALVHPSKRASCARSPCRTFACQREAQQAWESRSRVWVSILSWVLLRVSSSADMDVGLDKARSTRQTESRSRPGVDGGRDAAVDETVVAAFPQRAGGVCVRACVTRSAAPAGPILARRRGERGRCVEKSWRAAGVRCRPGQQPMAVRRPRCSSIHGCRYSSTRPLKGVRLPGRQ